MQDKPRYPDFLGRLLVVHRAGHAGPAYGSVARVEAPLEGEGLATASPTETPARAHAVLQYSKAMGCLDAASCFGDLWIE